MNSGIKVAGNWELEVLGVPYGGPENNRDRHGEYFSEQTDLKEEYFPTPPVVYYHGFTPDGKPQGKPEIIGRISARRRDEKGHWFTVQLNRASEYAIRVWKAAQKGLARASSGTIAHLRRVGKDGHILDWPLVELSLFDIDSSRKPANDYAVAIPVLQSTYKAVGIELRIKEGELANEEKEMPEDSVVVSASDVERMVSEAVERGITAGKRMAEAKSPPVVPKDTFEGGITTAIQNAFKSEGLLPGESGVKEFMAELREMRDEVNRLHAANRRLSEGQVVKRGRTATPTFYSPQFAHIKMYDHIETGDLALACDMFGNAGLLPNNIALEALEVRIKSGDDPTFRAAQREYMQRKEGLGFKADEIMARTEANYGLDWVGQAYSSVLWKQIRAATPVLARIPSVEVPQGAQSLTLAIEGTDPTWRVTPEVVDTYYNATTKIPNATIDPVPVTAGKATITPGKVGARVIFSAELDEDSMFDMAATIRQQLVLSAANTIETIIIDGDNTATNANINSSAFPAGAELMPYIIGNGFRKIALAGGATTSRDGAGALVVPEDFFKTLALLGPSSYGALVQDNLSFVVPAPMYTQILRKLNDTVVTNWGLTHRVEGSTIYINGLPPIYASANMHRFAGIVENTTRLVQANGTTNDTPASNTAGALVAVRFDRWKLGYKRRLNIELVRRPESDGYELIAFLRVGIVNSSSTAASAMTYGITMGS